MSIFTNPWLIFGFSIAIICVTVKQLLFNPKKPGKNLPPSPPTLPILGNLHQLGSYPHRSLRRLSRRHGPVMLLKFGSRPVVIVSSAEAAGEIMKTQDITFSSRPKTEIGHKLLYQQRDISAAPYGEYWRRLRSVCVVHLLSAARVRSFRRVREEETARLLESLRQSDLDLPANLSEMFVSLTSDVICRVAFGRRRSESERRQFRGLLSEFTTLLGCFSFGDFIPWLGWVNGVNGLNGRVDRVAKMFDEFLDGVVDEHVTESQGGHVIKDDDERKDFVDVLLEIQRDSEMSGFSIDRDNIKAILLDMFVGGTDTTYAVLEWAMTELLRHPTILKKLQDEVVGIAGGERDVSESDLDRLPYLRAVIKETLRLHPPIPLLAPRESRQDAKVNGFDIEAGTMVMTNAWAIGRDPASWDQPEEFMPERFTSGGSEIDVGGGKEQFRLIPFGAGRRGCPGVSFAMTAVEFVIANLVHSFDWELPGGARIEDGDHMTECVGLISHKKTPLLAIATPRF